MLSLHGRVLRTTLIAALTTMVFSGCMTGPRWARYKKVDPNSSFRPGSDAWWAEKAQLPVGTRQKVHKGKVYPPIPRPTGEKQQFSHKFHAAHYWPLPFVCQDREVVKNLWNSQVANGWTDATTLYGYHFDPETNELLQPGHMQLQWIAQTAPANRRIAFVQSSYDTVTDDARLTAVKDAANKYAAGGTSPTVVIRHVKTYGRPAAEVEMIRDAELKSFPVPRLGASGGGGGGGASAGGP